MIGRSFRTRNCVPGWQRKSAPMKNSKRPFRPRASIFDTARRDTLGRLMARNVPDPIPRNIVFDNSLAHLYFRRGVDAILGQVDQVQQPHSRTARIGLRATAEQEGIIRRAADEHRVRARERLRGGRGDPARSAPSWSMKNTGARSRRSWSAPPSKPRLRELLHSRSPRES